MIMTNKITDEPGSGVKAMQKGHQMMPFYCALRQKCYQRLAENFCNNARANGTTAFTDCETQTVVHRDRVDQGNNHFTRYLRAICAISRANRDTCCQSV